MKEIRSNYKEINLSKFPDCCYVCEKSSFGCEGEIYCYLDRIQPAYAQINGFCDKFERSKEND
ncbi:hypothetical protein M0R19_05865 [Candidatus Pacearchaeota archaeon]|jgi:hypothetical protein|nr:hypothetical protein [Candidatus Pacearchaeota archaeon]